MESNRQTSMETINYDCENTPYVMYAESYLEHDNDSVSVLRISNSREYKRNQRKKVEKCLDICFKSVSICILICIPIIIYIFEFYYAFTDTSCVNIKNKNISVNLYIYLLVDAIFGILVSIILSLYICFYNQIRKIELSLENYKKNIKLFSLILILFNLSWTIVGCIVFWNISNNYNYNCNSNIYSFVFIEVIFKLVFIFLLIIKITN
jgi:hypothetical protein